MLQIITNRFQGEQKAVEMLRKNIQKCQYEDLEEWAPKYLNCTLSYLEEELIKRKLSPTINNLALQVVDYAKEEKLSCHDVVTLAVMFELEIIAKHSQKNIQWCAKKFQRRTDSSCQLRHTSDFGDALRQSIVSQNEDAKITMKPKDELLYIAVMYRRQSGDATIITSPIYFAVSTDLRYVFSFKEIPGRLKEALLRVVGSPATKELKLAGPDVRSLLMMLRGREAASEMEPTIGTLAESVGPSENVIGIDFTVRTNSSVGAQLNIQNYAIQSKHKRWMGDDSPELRLVELESEVTFSGDVAAILARLPECGICRPPLPPYISHFASLGKSKVTTDLHH